METAHVLRNYVAKFQINEATPTPSVSWVKKIGVLVKGGDSDEEGIYEISTPGQLTQYTKRTSISRIFDAGSTLMYIVRVKDPANFANVYKEGKFFTLIFSEDFTDQEVYNTLETGLGKFDGVCARMFVLDESNDNAIMDLLKARPNFCSFATKQESDSVSFDNLYYCFSSLLSLDEMDNRQYIDLPVTDKIFELGVAEKLFDKKVSFALTDSDYGVRLSLFAIGQKPVIAPYIDKLLQLDIQAAAIAATNLYKPNMTINSISNISDYIKQNVINKYINPETIPSITFKLNYNSEGWIAKGTITMSSIKALWRYNITITKED